MNKHALSIGFLSRSVLSTELFWTRLFSAEFYYTFAFLILSFAVLGLGLALLGYLAAFGLYRKFIPTRRAMNVPENQPIDNAVTT